MRTVMISEYAYPQINGKMTRVVQDKCLAKFHQWGLDVVEMPESVASFTVAVVEYQDGKIDTVVPGMVRFIEATTPQQAGEGIDK